MEILSEIIPTHFQMIQQNGSILTKMGVATISMSGHMTLQNVLTGMLMVLEIILTFSPMIVRNGMILTAMD